MKDTLAMFKNGEIKLNQIRGDYFAEEDFARNVESVISSKIFKQYEEMLTNLSPEELQEKMVDLEEKLDNKLERSEQYVELKRVIPQFRAKVKKSFGLDDMSKLKRQLKNNENNFNSEGMFI